MPNWLKSLLDFLADLLTGPKPTPTTTTRPPVTTTTTRPPTTTTTTRPPATTLPPSPTADILLQLNNEYRFNRGVGPLSIDQRLMNAAQGHAEWMANTGNLNHVGKNGSTVATRIDAAGYKFWSAAENIAFGYSSAQSVMTGWMNSPGHAANMLNSRYADVGFGMAADVHGRIYWVADFGQPTFGSVSINEVRVFFSGPLSVSCGPCISSDSSQASSSRHSK